MGGVELIILKIIIETKIGKYVMFENSLDEASIKFSQQHPSEKIRFIYESKESIFEIS